MLVRALLAVSIALQYAAGVSFPPTISPWPTRRFWTNLGDYLQLGNSTLGGAVCERLLPRTAAHRAAILAPTSALTAMRNEDFSFDYAR